MSSVRYFCFQYPVNARDKNNRIFLVDTLSIRCVATVLNNGEFRTVDIDTITDRRGQDVTMWVPFLSCLTERDTLLEDIKAAAEAHFKGVLFLENSTANLFQNA